MPKGLPVKTISPGGAVNQVAYFKNGDVASTTDAIGLATTYTYDGLGQVLSQKVVSDTYPNGLTTSYTYDLNGQVVEEHDPQLTDRVTGATHAAVSSTVYDEDGNVTSQTVADASGGDTARTETQTYDGYDHLLTESERQRGRGCEQRQHDHVHLRQPGQQDQGSHLGGQRDPLHLRRQRQPAHAGPDVHR